MHKKTQFAFPVVGGSSLLTMFAVLCLTIFSLLALSTAQADGRLSQNRAQAVTDYYRADRRAEEIFAKLRQGNVPENVTKNETQSETIYTYTCSISDTQQLQVALRQDEDSWTVLRWQAESTVDWESDDTLHVWDGQQFGGIT